jgi:hypothetical protein
MESAATEGALPKVARVVKRLLDEGRRDAAQRAAGGPKELRYLEHTYHLAGSEAPKPVRVRLKKPPKEARPRRNGKIRSPSPARLARDRELARMRRETAWRLNCVERVTCAAFAVVRNTLPSRSQGEPVMSARMVFCVLARELIPAASVSEIMRYVDRNHATLHHYMRQFAARMESSQWFQSVVEECRRKLGKAFARRAN